MSETSVCRFACTCELVKMTKCVCHMHNACDNGAFQYVEALIGVRKPDYFTEIIRKIVRMQENEAKALRSQKRM